MIKFFSSGYFSRYVILLLLSIIIWLPSLLFPSEYTGIESYAYNHITNLIGNNLYLQTIKSFLLTLITAFAINQFALNNGFTNKISTLTALLYILLTSVILYESHNNPIIWANFILTFVLGNVLLLPNTKKPITVVFNASFLLGLASLFYSPLIILLIFIWAAIITHRIIIWRNFTVSIIGVSLPYVFLFTWFFYNNTILENSQALFSSFQINITPIFLSNYIEIIISVILFSIIALSMFGTLATLNEKNINLRRNLIVLLMYFISAFIIIIFSTKSLISTLLLSIPSALITAHWLSNIKKQRLFNIGLLLAIFLIILNQYLKMW